MFPPRKRRKRKSLYVATIEKVCLMNIYLYGNTCILGREFKQIWMATVTYKIPFNFSLSMKFHIMNTSKDSKIVFFSFLSL